MEDDEEMLEELRLDRKSAVVRLTTSLRTYELDLRKVDEKEEFIWPSTFLMAVTPIPEQPQRTMPTDRCAVALPHAHRHCTVSAKQGAVVCRSQSS